MSGKLKLPPVPVPLPPLLILTSHCVAFVDPDSITSPVVVPVVPPVYPVIVPSPIFAYPTPPGLVDPEVLPPGLAPLPPAPTVTTAVVGLPRLLQETAPYHLAPDPPPPPAAVHLLELY